ncbi:Vacuolar protein sorting-associated protein 33B [Desmophyllum pertusum]|uniref:Vacuolar protein sorting-associated protein 33B n=1 Tax=Desmophyllum pertusum TaxID=174260 RepID=A0A9W9Y840_9CNID|nr:Vacuolar protein sorting-associated protein 33B [Desmophyllum pertusum]
MQELLMTPLALKVVLWSLAQKSLEKDQKTKMLLNDQDKVFCDIRDRHFSNVFGYLSQKAKDVQSGYDKRQHLSTVSDMRQYVSDELRGIRQQHKGLTIRM